MFVCLHEDVIKSDPGWKSGFYNDRRDVQLGLRRHAQVWSVMGATQELYKREAWRDAGLTSLVEVNRHYWEGWFAPMDPNLRDLLATPV
jgi:homoserine O-acetyltransferase